MKKRAEAQQRTRERIVEAAVALHSTVGPADTSIKAIAEKAGVRRQTVYDHFPDSESLFSACSAHWRAANPLPDPSTWMEIEEPERRVRGAIEATYGWYEDVNDEFALFARDAALYPHVWSHREELMARIAGSLAATLPHPDGAARALRHALDFGTWQSLRRHGFGQAEATDAMARFVLATDAT
jgi:AcrR family transcriptional regulator